MANKAVVTQTTLDAIGQAIIAKGGATAPMTPAQMPAAIQSIPSGGDLRDFLTGNISGVLNIDESELRNFSLHTVAGDTTINFREMTNISSDSRAFRYMRREAIDNFRIVFNFPELVSAGNQVFDMETIGRILCDEMRFPKLEIIPDRLFRYCTGPCDVYFDAATRTKGQYSFTGCSGFNVHIPMLTSLSSNNVFANCDGNIYFGLPCSTIMGGLGYTLPWGASTSAKFYGTDGHIEYISGAWVKVEE